MAQPSLSELPGPRLRPNISGHILIFALREEGHHQHPDLPAEAPFLTHTPENPLRSRMFIECSHFWAIPKALPLALSPGHISKFPNSETMPCPHPHVLNLSTRISLILTGSRVPSNRVNGGSLKQEAAEVAYSAREHKTERDCH